jgi:hypothetical protein
VLTAIGGPGRTALAASPCYAVHPGTRRHADPQTAQRVPDLTTRLVKHGWDVHLMPFGWSKRHKTKMTATGNSESATCRPHGDSFDGALENGQIPDAATH